MMNLNPAARKPVSQHQAVFKSGVPIAERAELWKTSKLQRPLKNLRNPLGGSLPEFRFGLAILVAKK